MNEITTGKLIIFGKNGCLCPSVTDSKTGKSHAPNNIENQDYFDGVEVKCAELIAQGNTLAVISNEGGVSFGILTADEAELLVSSAAAFISAKAYRVCCTHPKGRIPEYAIESPNRLPAPGMLISLMTELGFTSNQTVMVGDWPFEREAAEQANVSFVDANTFFQRNDPFADRMHEAMGKFK